MSQDFQLYDFGQAVEDTLQDRLVCGVNDEWLQQRLLAERELIYQRTLELSQTFESSVKDAKDLHHVKLRASLAEPMNRQSSDVEEMLPPSTSEIPESPPA